MTWWRTLQQPAMFHGHGKTRHFFEGWYFKLVDASRAHRYAIIPGVFLDDGDGRESHAFVQVLDGLRARATYIRYPLAAFEASRREFDVRIGPNHFRADRLALDLNAPDLRLRGSLQLEGGSPWPVTLASPGIMGWYAYLPFMQCYHGVVSFDHTIHGALTINDEAVDFSGGRGYCEKDWGRSFPAAYIWLQSNHFATPGTCLTASVATIPWLGGAFRGFIVGLWHAGRLYRFATYTGATIERLYLTDTHVTWQLRGRTNGLDCRLELQAERAEGGVLRSPERRAMLARVAETMTARVAVRLSTGHGSQAREIFAGEGDCACLETVGDLERILDGVPGGDPAA